MEGRLMTFYFFRKVQRDRQRKQDPPQQNDQDYGEGRQLR